MNVSPIQSNRNPSVALALALTLSFIPLGVCDAAAVLSQDGSSLVVTLNDPVIFTTTVSGSGFSFGFLMPNAINIAGSGGFPISFTNAPTLLGRNPSVALLRGGATLEILYDLPSSVTIPVGTKVTLSPGVLRLPNFFNYSVILGIRNSQIPLVVFSDSSGLARSAPTAAIPEPATTFYVVGAGILAFARRRRRRSLRGGNSE